MTRPCPFCGESELNGLTHGHKEACFFDLLLRRGISEAEYESAWNRRSFDGTFSSIVETTRSIPLSQFTRKKWDQWGGINSMYTRVYVLNEGLRVCSWDGVDDVFIPTLEDLIAVDWFRVQDRE